MRRKTEKVSIHARELGDAHIPIRHAANLTPNIGGDGLNVHHRTSVALAIAQMIGGGVVGFLAIKAALVDLHNNHTYGLSINEDAATVFAIAAICIVALPVVAKIYPASKRYLRFATCFCLLVTVWAAFNAYSKEQGADILANDGKAKAYAGAIEDQEAARKTLKRINETADAATLETMVATAKAKADTAQAADTQKMGGKKDEVHCFKTCLAAKAEHMSLMNRLADAKARDEARKLLDKAKAESKEGPAEASGAATWIAAQTGGDATEIARHISIMVTVALIIGTQIIALLGHVAVSMIDSGLRILFPAAGAAIGTAFRFFVPARTAKEVPTAMVTEAFTPVKQVSKQDAAFNWVRGQIMLTPSRELEISGITMAKNLKVAPSTFASWVNRWIKEGKLERVKQGNKAIFSIPATKSTKTRRVA